MTLKIPSQSSVAIEKILSHTIHIKTLVNNDLLQPIAPRNTLPDPSPMVAEANSDDTEILDEIGAPHTDNTPVVPNTKDIGDKQGKRKGKLVVQSFQLAQNYKPKCRFTCVGCPQKFTTNRELNDHFRSSHPP